MSHPILDLQAADTRTDQLQHRRRHLPEQQAVDAASSELGEWQRAADAMGASLAALDEAIAASERDSGAIDTQRTRLERQLKTVIAPREAEALQHEIAGLQARRGELDDAELEALEQQSAIDDQMRAHAERQPALEQAVAEARAAAAGATAAIDAELADLAAGREALRAAVDPTLLARYDALRRSQVVAAAALNGRRCEGCHLDLSASEIDDVRAAAGGTGIAECPHCGRLLVL
jgi:predicted  nucleic acid-binding Zn-ribbon protein